ncbi:hypothetical protein KI387_027187, partial [Taxus chinensis]
QDLLKPFPEKRRYQEEEANNMLRLWDIPNLKWKLTPLRTLNSLNSLNAIE